MMRQYRQVKASLPPDTILLFRLGDFYEMFFEDALLAAPILDIALTKRQQVPMCGVPHHAYESYLAKLIRAGKKVAVCEQMDDPTTARGIVRREVTGIFTPGAQLSFQALDARQHNYLAGLYHLKGYYGLALVDLSTGVFWGEESQAAESLRENLLRYAPAECVIPAGMAAQSDSPLRLLLGSFTGTLLSAHEDWAFEIETAQDTLQLHFGVPTLDGFGIEGHPAIIGAAGGLLHYIQHALRRSLEQVRRLRFRNPADFLVLDEATRVNLDLVTARSVPPSSVSGARSALSAPPTLLGALDVTRTAMGGRLLREWLLRPLARLEEIRRRHDALETLCAQRTLLRDLRALLGEIRDLERGLARLSTGSGNARDLRVLGQSLGQLPALGEILAPLASAPAAALLGELAAQVHPFPDLVALVERAIVDEPPLAIKEGGLIRPNYQAALDDLRAIALEGKNWLAEYQAREQERTGIKTLKVRHNKVFGYYIEISKGQAARAPDDYTRKQTLVNAERFTTPELKQYETQILGAQDKAVALEYELFLEVRAAFLKQTAAIQAVAGALAQLDALAALAERALTWRYVRPRMTVGDRLSIRDSRHPVIEQIPGSDRFVPNSILLDGDQNRLAIITGPNMAGKSTYIRQAALTVIMAQMGSFVPAAEAEIGLVDRVFTRVGAGDDLARGRSTFMVEMQETANILHNATAQSLIVLDEIGRGTSTFDGISIAWAVAEHLHGAVQAKTLFATHYHELTDLALTLPGVKNYNILVREKNDQIVFLRRIVPGGTDKSYGIQVARLAGLPREVIRRAKEIMLNLEEGEFGEAGQPKLATRRPRPGPTRQLSLFEELG